MKHSRVVAASLAVSVAASLAGALPAQGVDVPFTERAISTTAGGPWSVFATDVDGDGGTDVLSALYYDDKIAWYENTTPPVVCGDGVVEGPEECDDFNTADGDGCSSVCTVEPGFVCTGQPSVCGPDCNGNGVRDDDDIADGTSLDDFPPGRSPDGIPDECQIRTPIRIDRSRGRAGRRPTQRPR